LRKSERPRWAPGRSGRLNAGTPGSCTPAVPRRSPCQTPRTAVPNLDNPGNLPAREHRPRTDPGPRARNRPLPDSLRIPRSDNRLGSGGPRRPSLPPVAPVYPVDPSAVPTRASATSPKVGETAASVPARGAPRVTEKRQGGDPMTAPLDGDLYCPHPRPSKMASGSCGFERTPTSPGL